MSFWDAFWVKFCVASWHVGGCWGFALTCLGISSKHKLWYQPLLSSSFLFLHCSALTFLPFSDFFFLPFPLPPNLLFGSSILISSLASAELFFHFSIVIIIINIIACVCVCRFTCATIYIWRSGNNFWELTLSYLGFPESKLSCDVCIPSTLPVDPYSPSLLSFFYFYIITYYRNTFKLHSYKSTKWSWELKL